MSDIQNRDVIVFIDDEKICHTLIELIIPNFTKFKLVSTLTGMDGIEKIKRYSSRLCLVISDILLSDINGSAVLKFMRSDKRFLEVPVIFQSGLIDQEDILQKEFNEEINILYKPYNQKDLLKSMKKLLPQHVSLDYFLSKQKIYMEDKNEQ